jgi:glutamyl-tRNA synthetase
LVEIVELTKERSRTTIQLAEQIRVFFVRPDVSALPAAAEKLLRASTAATALHAVAVALAGVGSTWSPDSVKAALEPLPAALGLKAGELFQPVRAALTGSNVSPEIYALVAHMGYDESLARVHAAHAWVTANA